MAAVSLFWNTNMAAVTSCENALFMQNLAYDGGVCKEGLVTIFTILDSPLQRIHVALTSINIYKQRLLQKGKRDKRRQTV